MARKLILAERAFRMLETDCLAHPDVETGGVLLGTATKNGFTVPFVVPSGPRARRSASRFQPDSAWQQRYLDYLFQRFAFDYVGDWHKHPPHFDHPSAIDLATARHIVTSVRWNKLEAVFPIATIGQGRVQLRAFGIARDRQTFEELPIHIVPDADCRVARLLTRATPNGREGRDQ